MPAETDRTDFDRVETVLLHADEIDIAKRTVATGVVRVTTTTSVITQEVEEVLGSESVEVERVAIGRIVPVAPDIRQEGDVTIIPIVEDVMVVEKRLILKEEVRVRRVRSTKMHRETVQLRAQAAVVTRQAADSVTQFHVSPTTEEDLT